jgi:hypothetical protein
MRVVLTGMSRFFDEHVKIDEATPPRLISYAFGELRIVLFGFCEV